MRRAGNSRAVSALLALALACAGFWLTALSEPGAAAEPGQVGERLRLPRDFFGVNARWLNSLAYQGSDEDLIRHVGEMRRLGIETVRAGPEWNEVEPEHPLFAEHRFDFSSWDRVMQALARFHIRASMLLIGAPPWARDPGAIACGRQLPPPRSAEDFARYAQAVADRYGRRGSFWSANPSLPYLPVVQFEVWNEPNIWDYWCPDVDPRRYADMFTESARVIHGRDPRARVVLGGLVGFDKTFFWPDGTVHGMEVGEFLLRVFARDPAARGQIDAIALHTYGDTPAVHLDGLRYMRERLRQIGLGRVPIVYNEFGWATSGDGGFVTDERTRARYLRRIITYAARGTCGVSEVDPYTWATPEGTPQDTEQWFGIADPETAQPHASAVTYSNTLHWLRGASGKPPPRRIKTC